MDASASADAGHADAARVLLDATATSSDAAEGAPCALNRECAASQRCECDEASGCFCMTGPRGAGVLGDPCTDGNDCASAVCVEGPDGAFYCSEECLGDANCEDPLPRCLDITFVGRICTRAAPGG